MGGKRSGKRLDLYLCAAFVLTLVLPSCASVAAFLGGGEPYDHMRRAERSLDQRDFEAALRECQEALTLAPSSAPGDEALFTMALIHAHYGNPKKDYRKSLAFFGRLVREFPGSPRVEEARIWIGVLESIEKARQVDVEIEERKKGLAK